MKVAIIGAGNVGGTLGTAWAQKAGHEIFFGVINPSSDQTQAVVRRLEGKARAGTPAQRPVRTSFPSRSIFHCRSCWLLSAS